MNNEYKTGHWTGSRDWKTHRATRKPLCFSSCPWLCKRKTCTHYNIFL